MIEINSASNEIIIKVDEPKEFVDNLRDALFTVLKNQSRLKQPGQDMDPDGSNHAILEFLEMGVGERVGTIEVKTSKSNTE